MVRFTERMFVNVKSYLMICDFICNIIYATLWWTNIAIENGHL